MEKKDYPTNLKEHINSEIKKLEKISCVQKTDFEKDKLNVFIKSKILKLTSKEGYAFYYKLPKFRLEFTISNDRTFLLVYQYDLEDENKELIFKIPSCPCNATADEYNNYYKTDNYKKFKEDLKNRHPYVHEGHIMCWGTADHTSRHLFDQCDITSLVILFNNIITQPNYGHYLTQFNKVFLLKNKKMKADAEILLDGDFWG